MTSTNHAEFYSSNEGSKMAVFFIQLRRELGLTKITRKITIHGDNEKALMLAKGRVTASKCRHYDLLLFYQREQFELGNVDFKFIYSSLNVSDVLTKGRFVKDRFRSLVDQLMGVTDIAALEHRC